MISNSGHDERGKYSGGQAGDQTGKEWAVIPWYNRPWDMILRHPEPAVQVLIAELAKEAAENDNIGYDQSQRWTFWNELAKAGYYPKNIKTKCEGDCSAGVLSICKAAGYLLNDPKLKAITQNGTTWGEKDILTKAGFKAYTAKKYRTSDKYLLPGDVLLNVSHHTAINLTKGALASTDGQTTTGSTGSVPTAHGSNSGASWSTSQTTTSGNLQVAKHKDNSLAGWYQVMTNKDPLNIRLSCGTDNKKNPVVGSLKSKSKIPFYGYYNLVGSVKWFLVQSGNVTGYVSSEYLKKVKNL